MQDAGHNRTRALRIIGTVINQRQLGPRLVRLTLRLPVPNKEGVWQNVEGVIFFDEIVTTKAGAETGFVLMVYCSEMRETPFGERPFMVTGSPLDPGVETKTYLLAG